MEKKDYKKLYLEQRKLALSLEMQILNMRAQEIGNEMPRVEKELKAYDASKNKDSGPVKA